MSNETFSGFPPEGIRFLSDLADNNDRNWFAAHKSTFQNQLQAPAQAFVVALGKRLQDVSPDIVYDTRLNGSGSLMRIYRDTRFSKDKTPYKTNVSLAFWAGPSKRAAYSAFYIRLEPGGGGIMTGRYAFDKPILAAYRDAVVDTEMGAELESVLAKIQAEGEYTIGGEHYKKVPRGYDPEHPRAGLLRYNGLHAFYLSIKPEHLTSAELVDICYEHCARMAPLHRWLVKVTG
jgi:uncharacterized protein (TIGR02453 family)